MGDTPQGDDLGGGQTAGGSGDASESGANPQVLRDYSEVGLERLASLRDRLSGLRGSLAQVRSSIAYLSADVQMPGLADEVPLPSELGHGDDGGTVEDKLDELLGNWEHLDGFAGRVADGFLQAEGIEAGSDAADHTYTMPSTQLAAAGIGFADRNAAIAEGERLAEQVNDLSDMGHDERLAWLEAIEPGGHDTAFSVAFTNELGTDGLEVLPDVFDLDGTDGVIDPTAKGALSTVVDTALATDLPDSDVPYDQRIDATLVSNIWDSPDLIRPLAYTHPPDRTPALNDTLDHTSRNEAREQYIRDLEAAGLDEAAAIELAGVLVDALEHDGPITGDVATALLLLNFDTFDVAAEGGDTDSIVSREDIRAIMENPSDYPEDVVLTATFLEQNRRFFTLLETTNKPDEGADNRVSDEDLELFVSFNIHLRTLNENFETFDTAAHTDGADGLISTSDLEALATGNGSIAEAAQWFLEHEPQRHRLAGYERDRALASGIDEPPASGNLINQGSVIYLAVDQQTYGAYDPAALNLPPGMIPPPPPQPYIDRGAALGDGSHWGALDDELKWSLVADAAEVAGETDAARHMRHYLDGNGDDLDLDVDRILREDLDQALEPREPFHLLDTTEALMADEVRHIADSGNYGQPIPFSSGWQSYTFGGGNWFHAIGSIQYSVTGVVTVDPAAGPGEQPNVEVEYQIHLYDRYNWDEGDDPATPNVEEPKSTPFPVLGDVPDSELAKLQRAGRAREYDMRGTSNTYSYEGSLLEPGAMDDPPDGRSGRDDPNRDQD